MSRLIIGRSSPLLYTSPPIRASTLPGSLRFVACSRKASTVPANNPPATNADFVSDAKWLSQVNARIGKCLTFGCSPAQVLEAGAILRELATGWREIVAGSEGFLTGVGRRGLWKHGVVWGDQVRFNGYLDRFKLLIYVVWLWGYSADSIGHVNNVTYLRYSESARVNWCTNHATYIDTAHRDFWNNLASARGTGVILRSVKLDYKFPMKYPDRITAFHKLQYLPEAYHDSIVLDVIIFSEKHRRPVLRAVEDLVLYDYPKGKKTNLGSVPFMTDVLRNSYELQEEAINVNRQRAKAVEGAIRALEQGSWDREDAVEDFGAAANRK